MAIFLSLFLSLSATWADKAKPISCTRVDQLELPLLRDARSARIFKRKYNFDARVRFYNDSGMQVGSCSTDLAELNKFNCWTPAGLHGEWDEVSLVLVVNSKERKSSLAAFKQPFELFVRGTDSKQSLTFSCTRD